MSECSSSEPASPEAENQLRQGTQMRPEEELVRMASDLLIQLDALRDTVDSLMDILTPNVKKARADVKAFLNASAPMKSAEKSYTLNRSQYREFKELQKLQGKAVEAARMVPQSFLVSMVSQYETYLIRSIRVLFKLRPEKLKAAARAISVEDIVSHPSIESVLDSLVEEKLDEVFRDSHLSQIKWFAETFDFTLDTKRASVQRLIEISERRNLYVHADGRISKQYVSKCQDLDDSLVPVRRIGDWIGANKDYIHLAHDSLFEVAVLTVQVAWRKARADQDKAQNSMLMNILFDLLTAEEYSLAASVGEFATGLRKIPEKDMRRFTVNRALAYKLDGKDGVAQKLINSLDWSAASPLFKLACDLISNDYSRVEKLVLQIPISDDDDALDAEAYRTWPLFKHARDVPEFNSAFEKKFGEPIYPSTINVSSDAARQGGLESPKSEFIN